jgi:spore coat polysaccharide biosynthesis protein SpsF
MKVAAIIEARMTSTRLPGKVLMEAGSKPMLYWLVSRLKRVESIDQIILATTININDNPLVDFATKEGISFFRGSEDNVMERVLQAAEHNQVDIIVGITGDCPLIDPDIVDQAINIYKNNKADYVSNAHIRSYPDGMDVQVYSLNTLKKSFQLTTNLLDYEHVTLHIRNNDELFSKINILAPASLKWPELGLTLDEIDDYKFLKKIIENLYINKPLFNCMDIIDFLLKNPDLLEINKNVRRKGDS